MVFEPYNAGFWPIIVMGVSAPIFTVFLFAFFRREKADGVTVFLQFMAALGCSGLLVGGFSAGVISRAIYCEDLHHKIEETYELTIDDSYSLIPLSSKDHTVNSSPVSAARLTPEGAESLQVVAVVENGKLELYSATGDALSKLTPVN